jgi:putative transposase
LRLLRLGALGVKSLLLTILAIDSKRLTMARSLRIQYPGAYYHVTCRGNERKEIFRNEEDRKLFQERLKRSLGIFHVTLLAYACMPNHFHLLICTPEGNLSEFMRHFNISYTSAFNRKYSRAGHLYQGRYKSFLIDADNYLLEVSRYIHLNPLRMKSQEKMVDKRWPDLITSDMTSLPGYVTEGERKEFISYRIILDYLGGDDNSGRMSYLEFVQEGIKGFLPNPLEAGKSGNIVGSADFTERIRKSIGKGNESEREQPDFRSLNKRFEPDKLIAHFLMLTGKEKDEICSRGRHSPERAMLMELLYRFCRITQPEIGKLTGGIDYSAVSRSRSRLRFMLDEDPELRIKFDNIIAELAKM